MKIRWNFCDSWAKGIFALKRAKKQPKSDAVHSTMKGIFTLNPFGKSFRLHKRLDSDEFMTFKYPKRKLLDEILKNL